MMVFDYKPFPPYLRYGVVSREGELVHETTVDLPGPRMQHDMAITENHVILTDMAMMWDPELLARGVTKVAFFRDKPTRFGVLPRRGHGSEIKWFETTPSFMYHTINAWEEGEDGDEVVLVGCKIDEPLAGDPRGPAPSPSIPQIGFLRLEPRLHRWRFHLGTGAVREERLDDVLTEFPRMDNRRLGRRSRYAYNPRIAPRPTLGFDGLVKYDTDAGTKTSHAYPPGRFGGEVVFAPREGATDAEDDGYLLTFVVDEASGESELYVLRADDVAAGPVARVAIPQRVPTGYHGWWVTEADLAAQRSFP
jgi:carotenoid cleavage dioxygenase